MRDLIFFVTPTEATIQIVVGLILGVALCYGYTRRSGLAHSFFVFYTETLRPKQLRNFEYKLAQKIAEKLK